MLKQSFLLLICLFITVILAAQQAITMPGYKQQMINAAGKKAAAIADINNLTINKALLPGIDLKPPVKDIKRLQLLPSQPPARTELVSSLQQSAQQLQNGIPVPRLEEIKQVTATLPVETIHEKAIMD